MDLPPVSTDLYDRLHEDVCRRGIQVPILVDSSTGEVIDGKTRKVVAALANRKMNPSRLVFRRRPGRG